jgi:hypothetical protein
MRWLLEKKEEKTRFYETGKPPSMTVTFMMGILI